MFDDQDQPAPDFADAEEQGARKDEARRIIRSEELLQGRREVWIAHGDDMYRLRITSSGKLYLTK
jgi:hemin uptake protein HemP